MTVATIVLALIAVAVVAGAVWLYGRHRRVGQLESGAQATAARILEEARKEAEAIRKDEPWARGLVAMEGRACIGWMKLSPRAAMPKLLRQGVGASDARLVWGAPALGGTVHDDGNGVTDALLGDPLGFGGTDQDWFFAGLAAEILDWKTGEHVNNA